MEAAVSSHCSRYCSLLPMSRLRPQTEHVETTIRHPRQAISSSCGDLSS